MRVGVFGPLWMCGHGGKGGDCGDVLFRRYVSWNALMEGLEMRTYQVVGLMVVSEQIKQLIHFLIKSWS